MQQHFREDLLYRLNTIKIEVPPLRERGEDIELLAGYFLKYFEKKYRKSSLKISSQAISRLNKYPWPGNVRELQHTIEKAVILSDSSVLRPEDFVLRTTVNKANDFTLLTLDEMEKQLIEASLEKHNGNYTAVANQLGITRQTLYNKIKRHDL
jgi:DNA-binding NtrC family response regulator